MMNSSRNQRESSMFWNFITAVFMMPLKIKTKKMYLLLDYSDFKFPGFDSCDCILYLLSEYFFIYYFLIFTLTLQYCNFTAHFIFLCISL